jgi:acyl-CoA reductase-like NAD-dependent aldehyde dehydrogenase
MLKHASQTLLVGERLAEALHARAACPRTCSRTSSSTTTTPRALIAARAFGFVNFTGSVAGGPAIERAAAGTFTALGLELGGKDPGYVMEDADLDWAVDGLMDGAMYNAGQCCCGIERIYVHHRLYDAFVEKAVAWVKRLKLGNPLDADTTLGPMANRPLRRDGARQTAEAVAAGAKPLIDPELSRRRRRRLSGAAGAGERRPLDARDARGELRPRRRHHAGRGTTTRRSP